MEIWIESTLNGRELREEILARHGSRAGVESAAKKGDVLAEDDLMMLDLIAAEPERLHHVHTIRESFFVDEAEFLLTVPRLKLVSAVRRAAKARHPLGVTDLARRLRRDKKNVSEDVAKLERWGLVRTRREGSRKLVLPGGDEIRVVLDR